MSNAITPNNRSPNTQPKVAPGSDEPSGLSELFPEDSRFGDDPLASAPVPNGTDVEEIEEQAHVVNYTTASGRYCELWWQGGDAGTPILAYLVDEEGPHYLNELSQPEADGEPPFASLEQAQEQFVHLAERFYAGR
jgi:hypothetical protein